MIFYRFKGSPYNLYRIYKLLGSKKERILEKVGKMFLTSCVRMKVDDIYLLGKGIVKLK